MLSLRTSPTKSSVLVAQSFGVSLDHFIRLVQHIRRNRQADLLGNLEIDDQFELRWLLNGKVSRLGTFEDLVYIMATRRYWSAKFDP